MVDRAPTDTVMRMISIGRKQARLVCGGERISIGGSDAFVQPTIFADVPKDASIAREEIFGPVLTIQSFKTEDKALAMAGDSIFGPAASVWTRDLSRALWLSDGMNAGTISVNTVDDLSAMTPFGGIKQSGFGRDLSIHSFDKYSALKTTWIKY